MIWADHPLLYHRPWIWLTTGQNAAGVQALAAAVATVAAIGAAAFAAAAWSAARAQAKAAEEQVKLARDQTQLAKEQATEDRRRYEEERRQSEAAAVILQEQRIAEEEAIRPRFNMGAVHSLTSATCNFSNNGTTAALEVTARKFSDGEALAHTAIVQPFGQIQFDVSKVELVTDGIVIQFRSSFGSRWRFRYRLNQPADFLGVVRLDGSTTPPSPPPTT